MPRRPLTTTYRLRPFPLALALIVVTTAMPVELRAPALWSGTVEFTDMVVNVLLYAPLGLALRRWPWWKVLVLALLLSASIETGQIWNSARHPSPADVAANVAGAVLATWLVRVRRRAEGPAGSGITVGRPVVAVACCAVLALLAAGNLPARPTAIAGWNPEFPLLLGNELTGDRPWRGTIESLALVPGLLSRAEVQATRGAAIDTAITARASFVLPAPAATNGGPGMPLPADAARRLARSAQDRNAFTVIARVVTADVDQDGPARIVSFSTDPYHRNFDLGQKGRQLVFRLRTPVSGENGERGTLESVPALEAGRPATVVASYDGRVARVYVDGRLRGRSNFAAAADVVPALADAALPSICGVMGALLALIAGAVAAGRGRLARVAAALAAGSITLALPLLAPGAASALAAQPWSVAAGLIGVGAVGTASVNPRAAKT